MSSTHLRTRPIGVGYLRCFEAVARLQSFRAAAEELSLTQSAVSRQIQSLESEVGASLFIRHTRAVELTGAGAQLLLAVNQALPRLDATVRQIRRSSGRQHVALTTFASFATMWLIPRLEHFQRLHANIDIRIDTSDTVIDMELADVDLALRYGRAEAMPPHAERLFDEQLTPVASPWLLKNLPPLRSAHELAQFAFIEAGDAHRNHLEWLTWQRWLQAQGLQHFAPQRWLYFNYAHQMVQAALTGQGVVLARLSMVSQALASGELVEVLPGHRIDSPLSYWLVVGRRSVDRPEVQAFCDWVRLQAQETRAAVDGVLAATSGK